MTDFNDLLSFFTSFADSAEDAELFSSKTGKLETNARFYHVMQKTGLGDNHFTNDSAKYRNNQFRDACKKNNVTILFSIVMGNHTHDLVMVNSAQDLVNVYRTTNTAVSKYIRKKNPKRFQIPGVRVFGERPTMKAVKSLRHLFYLPFYFLQNVRECMEYGKVAPFSCFEMYKQGFCIAPYNKAVFEKMFNLDFNSYIQALELSKHEFMKYEDCILSKMNYSAENEECILKLDFSKPWQ